MTTKTASKDRHTQIMTSTMNRKKTMNKKVEIAASVVPAAAVWDGNHRPGGIRIGGKVRTLDTTPAKDLVTKSKFDDLSTTHPPLPVVDRIKLIIAGLVIGMAVLLGVLSLDETGTTDTTQGSAAEAAEAVAVHVTGHVDTSSPIVIVR